MRFAVASRADIATKINQVYRAEGELDDLTSDLVADDDATDLSALTEVSDEAPVVRFVNLLITQAISRPGLRHPPRADRARPAGALPRSTASCTTRTGRRSTSRTG